MNSLFFSEKKPTSSLDTKSGSDVLGTVANAHTRRSDVGWIALAIAACVSATASRTAGSAFSSSFSSASFDTERITELLSAVSVNPHWRVVEPCRLIPPAISPSSYVRTMPPSRSLTASAPRATMKAASAGWPHDATSSPARSCLLTKTAVNSTRSLLSRTREKIHRSIRRSALISATPEGKMVIPFRLRTICAKWPLRLSSLRVSPISTTAPCDTTHTLSKRMALVMECVTASIVHFCIGRPGAGENCAPSREDITGPAVAGSCAEVGSSQTINGRRSKMVRAHATRCRSPAERFEPFCPR
mmetsp:Transcript_5457/g.23097  ORF Transcript_5457/g.23097 Transcript_5457/m.23097 type:complete len:302 (+) Transcript_5457:1-906(+)